MTDAVVVVGGGSAGLSAAIAAAEAGRDVTVLHRDLRPGGSSALAVGSVTASGTALQRAAGIADGPREHLEDLLACAEDREQAAAPGEIWRLELLAGEAGASVDWLADLGAELSGPHPEPPHRVSRMHNVVPGGGALVEVLEREALRRGVRIVTGRRAVQLIVDGDRVAGVRHAAPEAGSPAVAVSARTTILASGDASATFATERGGAGVRAINPSAQGDATRLAAAVGAAAHPPRTTVQLRALNPPYFRPSDGLAAAGAIVVGPDGRRFADELGGCATALAALRPSRAVMLFDAAVAERVATAADDSSGVRDGWRRPGKEFVATMGGIGYAYLADMEQRGLLVRAESVEQLAAAMGLNPGAVAGEVAAYNAVVRNGHADGLGRSPLGEGVRRAPFFGLGPFAPSVVLSDGGLQTDRDMGVLRSDGRRVDGLLAAGSCAWGSSVVRGHGQHLAWSLVSGRRAGRGA